MAGGLAEKLNGAGDVNFEMLVCPPAVLIPVVAAAISGSALQLGGQDCHMAEKGAHTGDTAAAMLKDAGGGYTLVGHSERRTDHGETDAVVKAKATAAQGKGLIAVVCIGETEAERDAGKTLDVNGSQIAGSVPDGATAANTVIAYEPVWAIGTVRTPTSAEVQDVHAFIRAELAKKIGQAEADKTRILYGGSMNPGNAKELLALLADVDGGLDRRREPEGRRLLGRGSKRVRHPSSLRAPAGRAAIQGSPAVAAYGLLRRSAPCNDGRRGWRLTVTFPWLFGTVGTKNAQPFNNRTRSRAPSWVPGPLTIGISRCRPFCLLSTFL